MGSGFRGEIGSGDADVHRAVVVLLQLRSQGGGLGVGVLGNDNQHRHILGKAVDSHAGDSPRHLPGGFPPADGEVVGLGIAGRGCQPHRLQHRLELLRLHRAVRVIAAAGLPNLSDFQKIHKCLLWPTRTEEEKRFDP